MSVLGPIGLHIRRITPQIRRHKRILFRVGIPLLITVIAVQLLYPSSQALPGTRLDGHAVGGETYNQLSGRIKTGFEGADVKVQAGDKSKTLALTEIGAIVETDKMIHSLLNYALWQRLIPFSALFKPVEVSNFELSFSDEQLDSTATNLSAELSIPAEDAKLTIAEGELTTTSAKTGQKVKSKVLTETLSGGAFHFSTTTLNINAEQQYPTIKDSDITPLKAQAEEIIQRRIIIVAENGTEFIPEPGDITSWLTVITPEAAKPELAVNDEQMGIYVKKINSVVGVPPGTIKATLIDSQEVSRTSALTGLAIAEGELKEGINKALFESSEPMRIPIRMVAVPPNVTYERTYTPTQKGLSSYVTYVASSEDVRIAVSQVGGKSWSASARGEEQTVAASTYKLYVSYMLFKEISDGKLKWDSRILDTDVAGCFERMIVLSDNPCAEEFVSKFGGGAINNYLYSKGISKTTTFISKEAAQTTAVDLEKMVRGIEDSSKISGSDRTKLLDAMARQRYRAGVSAGSQGTVYNKVGFLWGYLNDAAIVRHPKGTYTIAILTKGSSWNRVADITEQIEQIMYSET